MARRTATAALAGIGCRWHQRRDAHPTGRVPPHSMPQPCTAFRVAPWTGSHRSFRHRHTLRRLPWGIGRPRPRAEALRLCRLRSLAVATPESSAPTSGIATRPLRLHACHPDAALRLPSLSLSLHCRWRAVLLAHSLTLMPTRAFHSADAMLLVLHRQSTRDTSAAERCSALRASRRRLSGDAGASSGGDSLMPHRHPFPRPGHRCRSRHHIAARRPRRYASGWRAATQHGTQPGGASRSPTYPPLILLRLYLAIPLSAMSKARRTDTTCHCAADLRRGSGWLLESAACHGATLHFTSFRYGLRYG